MPPSRDDETQAEEEATLAAKYYHTLLSKGVGAVAAQQLTCAWILGKQRAEAERTNPLEGLGGEPR